MEIQTEVIVKGFELSVILDDIEVVSVSNDGIGSFECHGFKGFDSGQDYVEEYKCNLYVWSDREGCHVEVSPKLKEIIMEKLWDNEYFVSKLNDEYFESLESDYINSKIEEMRE